MVIKEKLINGDRWKRALFLLMMLLQIQTYIIICPEILIPDKANIT